jgi:haloalkane dehalogenase
MGGPIGLSYAIDHPNNVQKLVLFNTWMWSLHDNTAVRRASALLGSWFGRILYMQFNISPRLLIPGMTGDKTKLTKAIHQHYIQALPRPQDRRAAWMVVRELIDSSDWYDHLWQQRQRIANHPALLLWGMKDPSVANGMMDVARWQQLWPHAQTVTFAETGHFVQEEQGSSLVPLLHEFLAS